MQDFRSHTFCFLGRSGSGKDTQRIVLEPFFKKSGCKVLHVSTGDQGRALREKGTAIGLYIKKILEAGDLFPDWLASSLWVCVLNVEMMTDDVVILDSTPRRLEEAKFLDEYMTTTGRPLPIPIYLDISEEEATRRLLARGRFDDKPEVVAERLSWFKTSVLPIVDYYGKRIVKVDGLGEAEKDVFPRIMEQLKTYDLS